jgi:hypothetical protein
MDKFMGKIEHTLRYYTPAFKEKVQAVLKEINPVAAQALVAELHKEFLVERSLVLGAAFGDKTDFEPMDEATKNINIFHSNTIAAVVAEHNRRQAMLNMTIEAVGAQSPSTSTQGETK